MECERLFYTKEEIASKLGVSSLTVHRRIKDGSIPARKIGGRVLIPVSWIEELQAVE